jgi:GTP pyrophosphokinase
MLGPRFEDALGFAFRLHAEQSRKGSGVPYYSHLMAVSSLVLEYGGGEDQAIAALLHDSIEDQAFRMGGAELARETLATRYGATVAAIVESCTDTDTFPKPPWRARKERYIAHVAEMDPAAALVSCCDKIHNARAIVSDFRLVGDSLFERFSVPREQTLWYYSELAGAFARHHPGRPAEELQRTVELLLRLVRESDAAGDNPDPYAPPYTYEHLVLGRDRQSISWIYLRPGGELVVEFYDHGEQAERFNGRDIALLLAFDPAAQATLARALDQTRPDFDVQTLMQLLNRRFDSYFAVAAFVEEHGLPHRKIVDGDA